jgi:ParB family transcriptional regulator, chromosome partitioning protein
MTPAMLPISRIKTREQIRTRNGFDEASLKGLAQSIRAQGIIEDLIVTPDADDGDFWLVAGERRLLAAEIAGLDEVPVKIDTRPPLDLAEVQAIENLQREDLHPADIAQWLLAMKAAHPQETWKQIGERLGKSQSWVSKHIALTKLKPAVHDAMLSGVTSDVELLADLDKLARKPALHDAFARQLAGLEAGTTTRASVRKALAGGELQAEKQARSTDPDGGDGGNEGDEAGGDDKGGTSPARVTHQLSAADSALVRRTIELCAQSGGPFNDVERQRLAALLVTWG